MYWIKAKVLFGQLYRARLTRGSLLGVYLCWSDKICIVYGCAEFWFHKDKSWIDLLQGPNWEVSRIFRRMPVGTAHVSALHMEEGLWYYILNMFRIFSLPSFNKIFRNSRYTIKLSYCSSYLHFFGSAVYSIPFRSRYFNDSPLKMFQTSTNLYLWNIHLLI